MQNAIMFYYKLVNKYPYKLNTYEILREKRSFRTSFDNISNLSSEIRYLTSSKLPALLAICNKS